MRPAHLASLALATSLSAQSHTTTVPAVLTGTWSPTGNMALPLGRTRGFIQTWYRGDQLALGTFVTAVGWRPEGGAPAQAIVIEIVLDNTPVTFANLSATFASNLSTSPTTLLALQSVNLPAFANPTDPDQPAIWFPAANPFVYLGPHLIVQVDVQTSTGASSTGYNVDGYSVIGTQHTQVDPSCGGVLTASYANGILDLLVTGTAPGAPVIFNAGFDNRRWNGFVPLPLDLARWGMPGCLMLVDAIAFSQPIVADATGVARLQLPHAIGSDTTVAFVQALHGVAGSPTGYAITNLTGSILGTRGLGTYLYNFDRFGPTAEYGPFTTNRGAAFFVR